MGAGPCGILSRSLLGWIMELPGPRTYYLFGLFAFAPRRTISEVDRTKASCIVTIVDPPEHQVRLEVGMEEEEIRDERRFHHGVHSALSKLTANPERRVTIENLCALCLQHKHSSNITSSHRGLLHFRRLRRQRIRVRQIPSLRQLVQRIVLLVQRPEGPPERNPSEESQNRDRNVQPDQQWVLSQRDEGLRHSR